MIASLQVVNPIFFNLYTWGLPNKDDIIGGLTCKQIEKLCCLEEFLITQNKRNSLKLCLLYEPTDKNIKCKEDFDCIIEIGTPERGIKDRKNYFAIPLELNRNIIIRLISDMINKFTSEEIIISFTNKKDFPTIYRKFKIIS